MPKNENAKASSIFQTVRTCRVCNAPDPLEVMNFGEQYLASIFVRTNVNHPLSVVKVPLTVVLCRACGMVQLGQTVTRSLLFTDYYYRSGTNPMMRAQLQDVARDVLEKGVLKPGDYVLDVGCNDCTMLSDFPETYRRIGIDPASNVNWDAVEQAIITINDYFSEKSILSATKGTLCAVVTSIAMLYSVEDVNTFASEVKSILRPDGIWCIQVSYLPAIINNLSFYDVCHEHIYYFSLRTLENILEKSGLAVFDASTNDVNGGSLRVFVTHRENRRKRTKNYCNLLKQEDELHLSEAQTYEAFFKEVTDLRQKVVGYIRKEREDGKLVIGLGASTKGNVLLQFFGIDKRLLPYISERNPEKVWLRTLGTDIELISEERARELTPGCVLVLIWFFKPEIIRREEPYLKAGGKLLFAMPYCHIVTKEGERRL